MVAIFFLLLAVNKAQLASTRIFGIFFGIFGIFKDLSSAGTSRSFPPLPPTAREGRGAAGGRSEDTWFVVFVFFALRNT